MQLVKLGPFTIVHVLQTLSAPQGSLFNF